MKKYYLVFIFVFTSGFLMAQFTKTITKKDGSTETITKTTDKSLRTIYTVEYADKDGKVQGKTVYKKDLINKWEVDVMDVNPNNKREFIMQKKWRVNEKGEVTSWTDYHGRTGKEWAIYRRNSDGKFIGEKLDGKAPLDKEDKSYGPGTWKYGVPHRINIFNWFDNLKENTPPPPFPDYNESLKKEREKKCKEEKVSIYIGPSLLNGDSGSSKESFFGGQVYGLVSINSNIGIGADFSLNSKKNGDQKFTRSLILARGQYDFFTGDKCDKGIIPEAHILVGLGSESFKFTSSGNTSKSSQSGLAYGVGAGVGINISPNINLGLSVDYIGIKFEDTNGSNSNIRASAGIKISLGGGGQKDIPFEDWWM